ncbi:phosphoribosylamine--glycine ligase [Aerococcus urinae]|uniref:phosphoribosylamine--glycine ligase n=1 Tax=Aerococcus urinae TaxID=1376 RepID=UPI0009F8B89C|nr:phosphoribosylamine--glycine ligase [Aerococcus urinae]MDL5185500.1 phosphoribosylamine--glycine ligase [Aerococcus urinae]ORE71536.1 phosphoribosylamine--glycine ligase [Aerococcus urinae]
MKILVIGSGGREHSLALKFKQDAKVSEVYCAPGNPLMAKDGIHCLDISMDDFPTLIDFAQKNNISWTFVGPEIPLFNGIVDAFQAAGLQIFGPSQLASRLESSKHFAKEVMQAQDVPTAAYVAYNNLVQAQAAVKSADFPLVIKADGPAAGKGVKIVQDLASALDFLEEIFSDHCYGSQNEVVIEEYLEGVEFSCFSLIGKGQVLHLPLAQDHKRAYDHDLGPNTGGMGAYSPVPFVSQSVFNEVVNRIVEPVLKEMASRDCPYYGVLYTGLILTQEGPKVIEFNTRFGDPETQVVLPLLGDNFAGVIDDLLHGRPSQLTVEADQVSLGVVLAAEGYPGTYQKDMVLDKLITKLPDGLQIYGAGVELREGHYEAMGGRILMLVAKGSSYEICRDQVYQFLGQHPIAGTFYRKDIGHWVLDKREGVG